MIGHWLLRFAILRAYDLVWYLPYRTLIKSFDAALRLMQCRYVCMVQHTKFSAWLVVASSTLFLLLWDGGLKFALWEY